MATNSRGIPTLPSALIRQPAPPEPAEPDAPPDLDPAEAAEPAGQGRGDQRPPTPRARKRRPSAAAEKTSKRGVYLSDAVWERLQLEAIRKKTNISAIAGEVLERNLPRLRIEREG